TGTVPGRKETRGASRDGIGAKTPRRESAFRGRCSARKGTVERGRRQSVHESASRCLRRGNRATRKGERGPIANRTNPTQARATYRASEARRGETAAGAEPRAVDCAASRARRR